MPVAGKRRLLHRWVGCASYRHGRRRLRHLPTGAGLDPPYQLEGETSIRYKPGIIIDRKHAGLVLHVSLFFRQSKWIRDQLLILWVDYGSRYTFGWVRHRPSEQHSRGCRIRDVGCHMKIVHSLIILQAECKTDAGPLVQ